MKNLESNPWWIVVIIVASILALFWFYRWQSSKNVNKLEQKTVPAPLEIVFGPKDIKRQPDTGLKGFKKSRGKQIEKDIIPITLKTVIEFVDTTYIGETYTLKTFIFNTAKNAEDVDTIISDLMTKDQSRNQQQSKFETDSLYARDQDPVKVKIEIAAPNFTVLPASRIIEVPAGTVATSSHLIAPNNAHPPTSIISQMQMILISFDQILEANEPSHLGSIVTQVKVSRGIIPREINSELITQTKIRYFATIAGILSALITGASTLIAILVSLKVI